MPQAQASYDTGSVQTNISIPNCMGVRARAWAYSNSGGGPNHDNRGAFIYEIQAFGYVPIYQDIGLRVRKNSNTVHIGALPLSGQALRVNKNGTVWGIPLLPVNDPGATSIRVSKGGITYALPDATYAPLTNLCRMPSTTHYTDLYGINGDFDWGFGDSQTGGYGYPTADMGPDSAGYSYDGDFGTAFGVYHGYDVGDIANDNNISVISQHVFAAPQNVIEIGYRVFLEAYAYGNHRDEIHGAYAIEYTLDGTNWINYTGATVF